MRADLAVKREESAFVLASGKDVFNIDALLIEELAKNLLYLTKSNMQTPRMPSSSSSFSSSFSTSTSSSPPPKLERNRVLEIQSAAEEVLVKRGSALFESCYFARNLCELLLVWSNKTSSIETAAQVISLMNRNDISFRLDLTSDILLAAVPRNITLHWASVCQIQEAMLSSRFRARIDANKSSQHGAPEQQDAALLVKALRVGLTTIIKGEAANMTHISETLTCLSSLPGGIDEEYANSLVRSLAVAKKLDLAMSCLNLFLQQRVVINSRTCELLAVLLLERGDFDISLSLFEILQRCV